MSVGKSSHEPGYPLDLRGSRIKKRDASGPYGDVEASFGRIIARATGARVVLQDDNRQSRTPDLGICFADGRKGVCEVMTATDKDRAAEAASFADGGAYINCDSLRWQWWVTAPAHVHRRKLKAPLGQVLKEMEANGESPSTLVPIDRDAASPGEQKLLELGVTEVAANVNPGKYSGKVYWQPQGMSGDPIPEVERFGEWLNDFLRSDLAKSKAGKLVDVPGDLEMHLAIGVTRCAPWPVIRLLDREVAVVPSSAPILPDGVSHLWLWGCEQYGRALAWWPDRRWFDVAQHWVTD